MTHQSSYSALRMELLTPTDLTSEAGKSLPSGAVCRFKKMEDSNDLDECGMEIDFLCCCLIKALALISI